MERISLSLFKLSWTALNLFMSQSLKISPKESFSIPRSWCRYLIILWLVSIRIRQSRRRINSVSQFGPLQHRASSIFFLILKRTLILHGDSTLMNSSKPNSLPKASLSENILVISTCESFLEVGWSINMWSIILWVKYLQIEFWVCLTVELASFILSTL